MMVEARIAVLPGDGIGPDVVAAATTVLEHLASTRGHQFDLEEAAVGGVAVDAFGDALPATTLDTRERSDAVLLGAVGGPQWADREGTASPEQGLLRLRQHLGLFANLRPVPVFPSLATASPLKTELLVGVDILVVRELTGGIYFGPRKEAGASGEATDTMVYSPPMRLSASPMWRSAPRPHGGDMSPPSTRPMSWRRHASGVTP